MISEFFIRRPIVAMVIAILTVIVGLIAILGLPLAQFPEIVPPQIIVSAMYTGADAITIEQSVSTPLEQQMNGVDNMLYMQSTNANDGTEQLTVTFGVETNVNIDQVNVQNRIAEAQPNLPTDVTLYGIRSRKSTGLPMLVISLFSPNQSHDSLFLANYANINVVDVLYRVAGVGEVRLFGASDYAMRIWVRPDALSKLGLGVPDLASAVRQQSNVNPSGQIGGEPAPAGMEKTYTVRSQGRLQTPEEFGEIVVRANLDGSVVRLKDVARIELGALNYQQRSRANGQPGAIIAVFQAPGSNALAVANEVKKTLTELRGRFPDDLDYVVSLDTTLPVTEGIREIVQTLLEAMILVILVVFLFLQNWRATLIPMIAVPVSLIGTFAVFPLLGFSINTLSLFAFVLAIGLVVDDAIVVVEAVEHHIEQGLSPREATLQAMREVSGPVVAIAVILASVFLPVAFMGGIQGRLNNQFAVTIAISMLISAFNALTLSPALSALLLRPRKESSGLLGRFFGGFNRVFDKVMHGYLNWSHALIRKAIVGVSILAGVTLLDGLVGRHLPTGFLPEEDYGYAFLNVQLPPAASLERTDQVLRKVEGILAKTEGVQYYNTIGGFSLLTRISASYQGFFFLGFKPWHERTSEQLQARAIVDSVNRQLASQIPEAVAFAFMPPSIPGLGNAGGFSFWLQDRSGGSIEFLDQNLQKFSGRMPPASGASRSGFTILRRRAATLRRCGPRQGTEAGGGCRRRVSNAASLSRRPVSEPVQPLRPPVAGVSPSGRGGAPERSGYPQILRAEQRRRHGSALVARHDAQHQRSGIHQPLQSLPGGAGDRRCRAGLQFGTSHGRARRSGERSPPARDGLRLGRPLLPGTAGVGNRHHGIRAVSDLRVPDPGSTL